MKPGRSVDEPTFYILLNTIARKAFDKGKYCAWGLPTSTLRFE